MGRLMIVFACIVCVCGTVLARPVSVRADFVSVRTVPMVSGQLRSEGTLSIAGDSLEWKSDGYIFTVSGGKAYLTEDGCRKLLDGPLYGRLAPVFSSGAAMEPDPRVFDMKVTAGEDGTETVEARPKRRDMASVISKIIVVRKGYEVREVNVFAVSGAVTRVVFSNVELAYD